MNIAPNQHMNSGALLAQSWYGTGQDYHKLITEDVVVNAYEHIWPQTIDHNMTV